MLANNTLKIFQSLTFFTSKTFKNLSLKSEEIENNFVKTMTFTTFQGNRVLILKFKKKIHKKMLYSINMYNL